MRRAISLPRPVLVPSPASCTSQACLAAHSPARSWDFFVFRAFSWDAWEKRGWGRQRPRNYSFVNFPHDFRRKKARVTWAYFHDSKEANKKLEANNHRDHNYLATIVPGLDRAQPLRSRAAEEQYVAVRVPELEASQAIMGVLERRGEGDAARGELCRQRIRGVSGPAVGHGCPSGQKRCARPPVTKTLE